MEKCYYTIPCLNAYGNLADSLFSTSNLSVEGDTKAGKKTYPWILGFFLIPVDAVDSILGFVLCPPNSETFLMRFQPFFMTWY